MNRMVQIGLRHRKMSFEIHLCEHCNLNCKGCDNYSPLAGEEYIDIHSFTRQLKQMRRIFGVKGIKEVRLLGGEPLLHPHISEIVIKARKILPDSTLTVITNGFLLSKLGETFYKICADNDIHIMVTRYPVSFDYDAILTKMKNNRVVCGVFNSEPVKTLFKKPLDITGSKDARRMFDLCMNANHCIFLRDGRLYTCSTISNVRHFNTFFHENLQVCEEDSIDIFKEADRRTIRKFLSRPVPFCRYCDIENEEFDIPWSISKKEKTEWC